MSVKFDARIMKEKNPSAFVTFMKVDSNTF